MKKNYWGARNLRKTTQFVKILQSDQQVTFFQKSTRNVCTIYKTKYLNLNKKKGKKKACH